METLTLYWHGPIRFLQQDRPELEKEFYKWKDVLSERGIYIVADGSKIIYIGMAYDQEFRTRLIQHMDSTEWDCINRQIRNMPTANPFIKCGVPKGRYPSERIRDIEDLLIFIIDPPCKHADHASYTGRRPLMVVNRGNCWPLKEAYYTEDYADLLRARANVQVNLIQHVNEIRVGEDFNLEIQIVNVGREVVLLAKVEEILPAGFEVIEKPDYCRFEGMCLDMKGKRLDPLKTEEVRLVLRSFDKGTFEIKPRIVYVDEGGHQMSCDPEPVTIRVSEVVLSGRITTGYGDLDRLLFGGLPESYAVMLTSPSCDERELFIKRFLEAGVKEGQITFFVTIEASGVRALAEEFQSNFYLFICNPQADRIIESLPNVFKLKGVGNLTDISIALTSAFRRLDETPKGPRRACIEIVSDVLLQHHAVHTRRWLTELIPNLGSRGFTTLAVMNPQMHPPQEVQAILGVFEGEINIYEREAKKGLEKFLRIRKMYDQRYLESELCLRRERLQR